MSENIKVQSIYVKRFKKLEDLTENFNGNSVIICGPNEHGKTSILQFLRRLMGDDTITAPNSLPEGEVKITKGDKEYILKAIIEKGKSKIIVCCDGMEDIRPGTLETLIGAISFDPFYFVEKSKTKAGRKDQIEDIKKLLPEDVRNDLARYEADVAAKYEERTGLNKTLKEKEGFIKSHTLYNETPNLNRFEFVDVTELQNKKEAERARLNELYKSNKAQNDKFRAAWNNAKELIEKQCKEHNEVQKLAQDKTDKIGDLLIELMSFGYDGKEVSNWKSALLDEIKPYKIPAEIYPKEPTYITEMPDDSEIQNIDALILSASEKNSLHKDAQDLKKKISEIETLKEQVGELTVKIESGRQAISDAVKEMANILDGLAYDDEGLTLNGIPVHPNSLSESQLVVLAYKIKRFENPYLPLFVDKLECFDKTKYEALLELAKEDDIQVIGAEVSRTLSKMEFHLIKN